MNIFKKLFKKKSSNNSDSNPFKIPFFTMDMDTAQLHQGLHPKIRLIGIFLDCFNTELKNIEENERYSKSLKNIFAYFKQEGSVNEIMKIVAKKINLAEEDGCNHNSVVVMVDQPVLIFIDIRPQCSLDNLGDNWKRSTGTDYLESIEGLLNFANSKGALHIIHLFFCYDANQSGVAIAFIPSPDTVMEIGSLFPYSMVNKVGMY